MKRNSVLWIILIISIVVIFFISNILAIWLTIIFLIIAIFSYIISLTFKRKLIRTMQKYKRINDTDVAKELNSPIEKVREKLSSLYKHQKKKIGLTVFLNNRYIFYNQESLNEFKRVYAKYAKEKQILEKLQPSIGLKTRAEVKVIKDTLINHKIVEKV